MTDDAGPDRLPAELELPDGHALAFSPHRECPCSDCTAAFDALKRSNPDVAEDGEEGKLPWM